MELTRGDTGLFKFQRVDANGDVITSTPDAMYFTLKKSYSSPIAVVQKTLADMTQDTDGYWHITLEPEDTENIDVGAYVYDIEVTVPEYVKTIAKGTLRITAEATWAENK